MTVSLVKFLASAEPANIRENCSTLVSDVNSSTATVTQRHMLADPIAEATRSTPMDVNNQVKCKHGLL